MTAPIASGEGQETIKLLKCDECGVLTFDLRRLGEIHSCMRAGAFRVAQVEPVAASPVSATPEKCTICGQPREFYQHHVTSHSYPHHDFAPSVSAPASASSLTYRGTDWREALERNVTVALEFAAHALDTATPNVDRALGLAREAIAECQRLLAPVSAQSACRICGREGVQLAEDGACGRKDCAPVSAQCRLCGVTMDVGEATTFTICSTCFEKRRAPERETTRVCEYARSDMTPCVLKDGDCAQANDGACVGCGRMFPVVAPESHGEPVTASETEGKWPDPTPEMLRDPVFTAIWEAIKTWDINVPSVYDGYCGAAGNHARAILEAVRASLASRLASSERENRRLRTAVEKSLGAWTLIEVLGARTGKDVNVAPKVASEHAGLLRAALGTPEETSNG